MRTFSVLLAATTGFAFAASPLSAQADRQRDAGDTPPITWCDKPAPAPKWERQTVSFLLEITESDSSEFQQRLRPYLPFLLSGIAERYMAEHQPMRDIKVEKSTILPPGEPRYSPADLEHSLILFDLLGNGTIDSVKVIDTTGSRLVADLKAAVLAAAARGDVFGPYADSAVRTRFGLFAGVGDFSTIVAWPAFTLHTPVDRPAAADPKNRPPSYPTEALNWNGKLLFRYKVDENGRAVQESITVAGADNLVWQSEGHRKAFEHFRRQVETVLPKMRFRPAEKNGCFITTWVQQEFVFQH